MVSYLASLWNRGLEQLGNGLIKKFPFILLSTDYLTFPSGKMSKSPVSSSITPLSLQILENKAFIWFHFKRKQRRPNADSQTRLQFRTEGLLAFWSAGRRQASCWPRLADQKARRLWVQPLGTRWTRLLFIPVSGLFLAASDSRWCGNRSRGACDWTLCRKISKYVTYIDHNRK